LHFTQRAAVDRRAPGADVEAALVRDVDAALNGGVAAGEGYAAKAIVGGDGSVARDGDRRGGSIVLGQRRRGGQNGTAKDGSSQKAADGRKHHQFPFIGVKNCASSHLRIAAPLLAGVVPRSPGKCSDVLHCTSSLWPAPALRGGAVLFSPHSSQRKGLFRNALQHLARLRVAARELVRTPDVSGSSTDFRARP